MTDTKKIPLKKYWETYSIPDEVCYELSPYLCEKFFNGEIDKIWKKYIKDINNRKTKLSDKQLIFFSKNIEMRIAKYRDIVHRTELLQIRLYFNVDEKVYDEYSDFLRGFIE